MHLQRLVFWEKRKDYIEIQQADQKLYKMEETARFFWQLLWAFLNKAKGLKSVETGLKTSKVISYIWKMWTVVRRGVLSLFDQEKSLWNLNMHRGCWSGTRWRQQLLPWRKELPLWSNKVPSVLWFRERQGDELFFIFLQRTLISLALNAKLAFLCKPCPFHVSPQWAACTSLFLCLEWHRATLSQGQVLASPSVLTSPCVLTMCCTFTPSEWTQGLFHGPCSYHYDALSNILHQCT